MFNILFPTDFSATCQHALEYLLQLVDGIEDARIDVLHVFDSRDLVKRNMHKDNPFSLLNHRTELDTKLQSVADSIPRRLRGTSLSANCPYPSTEIVKTAKNLQSQLICMGLRQKYSMTDRLIGTITGRTLESTSCPVLAVPNGASQKIPRQVLLISNLNEHPVGDQINRTSQELVQQLNLQKPTVHLFRLGKERNQAAFEPIYQIMQTETIDAIFVPSNERELLTDLYYSKIPRDILYRARLPLFLI